MWSSEDGCLSFTPFPAKNCFTLKPAGDMKDAALRSSFLAKHRLNGGFTCMEQVHSSNVGIVLKPDAGKVFDGFDALVTNVPGIALGVFVADCVPVIVAGRECSCLAAIHAGWRGLDKKIIKKSVDILVKEYGARPDDLSALIGPHIQKCCYTVGKEFQQVFSGAYDSGFCDLDIVAVKQLEEMGIKDINSLKRCSCHEREFFFSYRRDKNSSRMLALAQLE